MTQNHGNTIDMTIKPNYDVSHKEKLEKCNEVAVKHLKQAII